MLCQECKKKPECVELCKKAEKYVNQDYVPPEACQFCSNRIFCCVDFMEGNLCPIKGLYDVDLIHPEEIDKNPATKSNEEIIIELFFTERMKVVQIAKIINVSHQYVSKTVKRYRELLIYNLKK